MESSILDGTWKQLKQELAGGKRTIWTVHNFYRALRRSQRVGPFLTLDNLRCLLGRDPRLEGTCPNRGFVAWRHRR